MHYNNISLNANRKIGLICHNFQRHMTGVLLSPTVYVRLIIHLNEHWTLSRKKNIYCFIYYINNICQRFRIKRDHRFFNLPCFMNCNDPCFEG